MFPVQISNLQIPIGKNWTVISPLQANHNYHIYCYGAWISTSSAGTTDYDFYVYDPQGNLVSTHTESAGLPPHLGTTTSDPLFTPELSGNYSFVISNNPFDSAGAQPATFMIIEDVEPNTWFTTYLEGDSNVQSLYNFWSYEFETNASYLELYLNVPKTLDVYEARLYLMNNAQSPTLNSFPLPWEPGLYGNLSGSVGGYNFDPNGYRGAAYDSEEYAGQPMFLNYTSANNGPNLYQLVLLGESGSGNIELMMKTQFGNQTLTPLAFPSRVYPDNATEISYISNTSLDQAQLTFTTDNWGNATTVSMQLTNQTCNATIPGQEAGSVVQYKINATDFLKNNLVASGNYTVKAPLALNITEVNDKIRMGDNVTITGIVQPSNYTSEVKVQFTNVHSVQVINCTVSDNGSFVASFKPAVEGTWLVSAYSPETQMSYRSDSQELTIVVAPLPFYLKYSLFIMIGVAVAIAVGVAVYFFRFRRG